MLPVLEQLEARLDAALAHASDDLQWAALRYRSSIVKWRPDPPAMSRAVTAFMARETLRGTRKGCIYSLAKARYESLRRSGDPCDCAARVEATFMYDRPNSPLECIDSVGVDALAVDALWRCNACGTKWHEAEGCDDGHTWSTWTLAPADAMKA